jgi:hypothetical protein
VFYKWRFELALKSLGFDPGVLPRRNRNAGILTGQAGGDTPQEAAIVLVSMMPPKRRLRPPKETMRDWVLGGKLDLKKHHVREALDMMGCAIPHI